jgi:hypothetical protein
MLIELLVYTATFVNITIISKLIFEDIYNNNNNLRQIKLMPYTSYNRVLY